MMHFLGSVPIDYH